MTPRRPHHDQTDGIRAAPTSLAREPLLDGGLVFRSKRGQRLSQPTLTQYWKEVRARAGLDHEFYLATKHFAVHALYVRRELSDRAIAAQMGWSVAATQKPLAVYGHGDVGALEEIDAAFAGQRHAPATDPRRTFRRSGRRFRLLSGPEPVSPIPDLASHRFA